VASIVRQVWKRRVVGIKKTFGILKHEKLVEFISHKRTYKQTPSSFYGQFMTINHNKQHDFDNKVRISFAEGVSMYKN
jgi:hypothetical protein